MLFSLLLTGSSVSKKTFVQGYGRTQQANFCEDSHAADDTHVCHDSHAADDMHDCHAHMSMRKTNYTCSSSTEHDRSCIGLHDATKTITSWP